MLQNLFDNPIAERIQIGIVYFLRLTIVGAMIIEIIYQRWSLLFITALILLVTYTPSFFEKRYKINLPLELEVFVILFLYASFFLGEVQSFYAKYWWWDVVLHAGSGIALGYVGFIILYVLYGNNKIKTNPLWLAFFSLSFAMSIGALWEIFEFGMDQIFGWNMQKSGLVDTMWDLIVDFIGALIVSVIGYFYLRKKNKSLFGKILTKFMEQNPHLTASKK